MNSKLYIRFSNDIYEDIERGYSFFKGGEKLDGLCAWTTPYFINNGRYEDFNGNEVKISDIESLAQDLIINTYGSYSDNSIANIITGTYVGSGNDGVLLQDVELISTIEL